MSMEVSSKVAPLLYYFTTLIYYNTLLHQVTECANGRVAPLIHFFPPLCYTTLPHHFTTPGCRACCVRRWTCHASCLCPLCCSRRSPRAPLHVCVCVYVCVCVCERERERERERELFKEFKEFLIYAVNAS